MQNVEQINMQQMEGSTLNWSAVVGISLALVVSLGFWTAVIDATASLVK
jgi:hypothetical protein